MKFNNSPFYWYLFVVVIDLTTSPCAVRAQHPAGGGEKLTVNSDVFNPSGAGNIWPQLQYSEIITTDGKYVGYKIINSPTRGIRLQVVESSDGLWKKTFPDVDAFSFSTDGQWAIVYYQKSHTLKLLRLGSDVEKEIEGVSRFMTPGSGNGASLAYLTQDKDLHLLDINSAQTQSYTNCNDFGFSPSGKNLVFQTLSNDDSRTSYALHCTNTINGSIQNLAESTIPFRVNKLVFNAGETAMAWVKENKSSKTGSPENSLWYRNENLGKPEMIAGPGLGIPDSLYIASDGVTFNADGDRLLFSLKEVAAALPQRLLPDSAVMVDISRYRDLRDQADQLKDPWDLDAFYCPAVIDLTNKKIMVLGGDTRNFDKFSLSRNQGPPRPLHYLLYSNAEGSLDYWWNKRHMSTVFLLNVQTGTSIPIKQNIRYYPDQTAPNTDNEAVSLGFHLSPFERYVLYFDPLNKGYYSYDISNGKTFAISRNISADSFYANETIDNTNDRRFQHPEGIIGWLKEDQGVLVSDNYDIWLLDLSGHKAPVNITGGYGRRHHIVMHLNGNRPGAEYYFVYNIMPGSELVLTGFNEYTKHQGFYRVSISNPGNLERLSEGPYHFSKLKKAGNTWIVIRETTQEAPNLYSTKDFKSFTALTDLEPQKNYNWLTGELVSYKLPDGRPCQGILYKPENFDPQKKYPVIFYYYEKLTQELYQFQQPQLPGEAINIPVYVNKGYLVFLPDIWYKVGHPGDGAMQSVTTAAKLLAKRPYVDSKHMGLQGHSWGAYETYYIIAHSHQFAAAVAGDGPTDFISGYGAPRGYNMPATPHMYEHSQCRIGATPWQRPDLYIENSPVLRANHITTPLLMQHSKHDWLVNYDQGVELFTALRRLDRRAWLLQYDQGSHGTALKKDETDFSIRMGQFFDHYLQGAPAPKWMVEGIPAKDKGFDKGYELEPGREP
jgi:dienelactone hydrolase